MLYLNMVVISKRHWNRGDEGSVGWHFIVRALALAIGLFSLFHILDTSPGASTAQLDMTHEKLFQLHPTTLETLEKARELDRKVTVQAFISEDMPQKYTNAKKDFEGMLRRYDSLGGKNVDVIFKRVRPSSNFEIEAEKLGIDGVTDRSEVDGVTTQRKVFLGAHVASSEGETVLPFIDSNLSVEYELSQAIFSSIEKGNKSTIGLLETDARFGGVLFDGRRIPWAYGETTQALKKQFKVKYIEANSLGSYLPEEKAEPGAIEGEAKDDAAKDDAAKDDAAVDDAETLTPPDVLVVADPASLDAAAMANLIKYIEAGNPTILLADPLPFFWAWQHPTNIGVLNAPRMGRVGPGSGYTEVLASSQLPKADGGTASSLFGALGVRWDNGTAVWNNLDAHPGFEPFWPPYLGDRWPEYYGSKDKAFVFIKDRAEGEAFNSEDSISRGLRELLMIYPGANSKYDFTPLVSLGTSSGKTPWDELTDTPSQKLQMLNPRTGEISIREEPAESQITGESLIVLKPDPATRLDEKDHVVAARVQSKESSGKKVDVVIITDLDFLSDMSTRQENKLKEDVGQQMDNLSLLVNSIDVLAGNDGLVDLRGRRPKPRTLTKLESIFETFREERLEKQQVAEEKVEKELAAAQKKLDDATKEIRKDESLSFLEKLQQTSRQASNVQRQFELSEKRLNRELEQQSQNLRIDEQGKIRGQKEWYRWLTTLISPLPPLMLGIVVLFFRLFNEQRNIDPKRRAS